jgi:two-component system response regulator FixJ
MPSKGLVHVIDDDVGVRESLQFMLKAAKYDVRAHDSAVSFLAVFTPAEQSCVVTDVRMPEMSGVELLRKLKEMSVDTPVILVTGHGDVSLAVEAMKAGASDFIEKPFAEERVLKAIEQALNKYRAHGEIVAQRAVVLQRIQTLSQREREVLDGLVAGSPNKVIAHELSISPRTVEIYRANVMSKMDAGSLSELVRMVLLSQPGPAS